MSNFIRIISCFFNHSKSAVLLANLKAFHRNLGAHKDILTIVECVPLGAKSQLDGMPNVITVHSNSILWQKERLLNIALDQLDPRVEAVIWCDTDLEFENPEWVAAVHKGLDDADVIQPFGTVLQNPALGESAVSSFGQMVSNDAKLAHQRFHNHGHSGYVWAINRNTIQNAGFFDECVVGGADHVMAHAFTGTPNSDCIAPLLGQDSSLARRYERWTKKLLAGRDALRLSFLPQTVYHKRHGSRGNRMYVTRNQLLDQTGFDPEKHLVKNKWDCWEWSESATLQRELAEEYFQQRQEDQYLGTNV